MMGAIGTWWRRVRAGAGGRDAGADTSAVSPDAVQPPEAPAAPTAAPAAPDRRDGPASFDQLLQEAADRRPPAEQARPAPPSA